MPVQEALSFNDLESLGSSPSAVRDYFTRTYGKTPDGICVNGEGYYNAVAPTITQQYGLPCHKIMGDFTYELAGGTPPSSAVLGSNYAVNRGTAEAQITLTVTGNWSEALSWSSSITGGLKFSVEQSVKVGGGAPVEATTKIGAELSVSVTAGRSGSETTSRSTSASVTVKVPPKSKMKVSMIGTMKQETTNFHAPITIHGSFGANFPDRVNDHYFWFADANAVLAGASATLNGSIKHTAVFDVQTEVGEVEPLESVISRPRRAR